MDLGEADSLVQQLAAGFEVLQDEYQKLFGEHQALERKLATAREQYNQLVKLCDSGAVSTPPLTLSPGPTHHQASKPETVVDVLANRASETPSDIAIRVRNANQAVATLRKGIPKLKETTADGVRIWTGPSADKPDTASQMMPSISESPLEQDFTIEGLPSRLGCPFASMANKNLSSHAASVLSRYNPGSTGGVASTPMSSVSRVNGKESFARKSDRRASFADPIKAEICGLSDHDEESPHSETALNEHLESQENAEAGVCPIRFLDQHSPEEVATYFERHKHELPRSHEICVKRYQSNEKQIRELDEKYGNLVSMIQGLGAKHKELLPEEPDGPEEPLEPAQDDKDAEKVRKWASSVSAQAAVDEVDDNDEEERLPHFERPLRDIRVGESPSRPWGISVPAKYIEQAATEMSSKATHIESPAVEPPEAKPQEMNARPEKPAQCPFGFSNTAKKTQPQINQKEAAAAPENKPAFIAPQPNTTQAHIKETQDKQQPMVFTGPVFVGYSAEDAAKILRESGLAAK